MKIYFYLPIEHWPDPFPSDRGWVGYSQGIYCWTLQTYIILKEYGYDCELTSELPETGVIVSHRGSLPDDLIPKFGQYLVCIQADWSRHPYAHAHISQNREQTRPQGVPKIARLFSPGVTYFIHLWLQPAIVMRDSQRESELKTISYFGLELNLTEELQSDDWKKFIEETGLEWNVISDPSKWSNYTNTDAVLFVRDFKGGKYINKPGTKLYNSWVANSIPVCSPESAYVDEIDNSDQALLVKSYEDLKKQITLLKSDPNKFGEMLRSGRVKSEQYSNEIIASGWMKILDNFRDAKSSRVSHFLFIANRSIGYKLETILKKIFNR